jgi:hypothetical protein
MPTAPENSETPSNTKIRRAFLLGYRRADVDLVLADAEAQQIELREQLMERGATIDELEADLTRARREVRYWEDRQNFVEAEVERARASAERVEKEARERAEEVERDAKDRSLQMIDRVCAEANAIVQHARDEAREMATRFQDDVVLAEQRIERLRRIEVELQKSVRTAIDSFESGIRTLQDAAPSAQAVETEQTARKLPSHDFGKSRAVEAARRYSANKFGVLPGLERESAQETADDTVAVLRPIVVTNS